MTPCSQGRCATMLRYVPNAKLIIEDREVRNKDKLVRPKGLEPLAL